MEELLKAVRRILQLRPLDSIEQFVISQSWLGKTYSEMAEGSGYGRDYIKQVGSQLWQELSEAVGERVTKKNLHLVLLKYQQDRVSSHHYQYQSKGDSYRQQDLLDSITMDKMDFPSGPVPLDSPLYISRTPLEELVLSEIMQPGCLVRIKAPRKMGKSSLLNRTMAHAREQGYQTVYLDFQEADEEVFVSLDKFLRWFCINISRQLNLVPNLDDFWDADMGSKISCKIYFEAYLLQHISSSCVVLALNELNRVFEHPNIAQDFLPMLRCWHEQAKQDQTWQKLRLVVVHTTEIYIPLKLNQSPFNVGITILLPPFTLEQVQDLAQRYDLNRGTDEIEIQDIAPLQAMMGGHPYLISLALYNLCQGELKLDVLLQQASTPAGIYSQHLRELLTLLQAEPQLISAMQQVVTANQRVQLDALTAYKLESMGLVKLDGNQAYASCELYSLYFRQQLVKQNGANSSLSPFKEEQQAYLFLSDNEKVSVPDRWHSHQ